MTERSLSYLLLRISDNLSEIVRDLTSSCIVTPVQRTTRHTAYKGVFHNAPQMRTFAKTAGSMNISAVCSNVL